MIHRAICQKLKASSCTDTRREKRILVTGLGAPTASPSNCGPLRRTPIHTNIDAHAGCHCSQVQLESREKQTTKTTQMSLNCAQNSFRQRNLRRNRQHQPHPQLPASAPTPFCFCTHNHCSSHTPTLTGPSTAAGQYHCQLFLQCQTWNWVYYVVQLYKWNSFDGL